MKQETCQNPFHKKKCKNTDIHCYITEDHIPLCTRCFLEAIKNDYVWDP